MSPPVLSARGPRKPAIVGHALLMEVLVLLAITAQAAVGGEIERHVIRVGVIHASNEALPKVDPGVALVRRRLENHFHFTSFRLIQQVVLSLGANEVGRVLLPNDTRLEIEPTVFEGPIMHMNLKIIRQRGDRHVVEISARSPLEGFIVIGGETHERGILILVVSHGR